MSSLSKLLSSCKSRHSGGQHEPTPSPSCSSSSSSSCRGLAQRLEKTVWASVDELALLSRHSLTPHSVPEVGGGQQGRTDKVGVGLALEETDLYEGDPRGCTGSRRDKGRGFCLVPGASCLPLRDCVPNVTSGSHLLL